MSGPALLGLHQPGNTLLHRAPAGVKLVGLVVASLVVMTVRGPWTGVGFLVGALAVAAWAGAGWRTLRSMRLLLLMAAVLAAYTSWQRGWERGVEVGADLLALVLLATVVTLTTPLDVLLDAVTRGLRPLRRVGIDPDRVGLAIALMLRAVPTTIDLAIETRDAARARGLERDPRARLTPLVIRTVAHARATGEALHARGVGD